MRRAGSGGNGKDGAEIGMYSEGRKGNLSFQGEMWERSPQTEVEGRIVSVILIKITVANNMEQTCLSLGGFAKKEYYSNPQYNLVSKFGFYEVLAELCSTFLENFHSHNKIQAATWVI